MTVDSVIDVLMLLTAIIGMLGSLYSYIEKPNKGWLFLTGYYFASFLSGYYWITSTLVTHMEPKVSEFTAYFGWNAAYVVLLVAVYEMRNPETKGFRPIISFIPIPLNLIQFFIGYQVIFEFRVGDDPIPKMHHHFFGIQIPSHFAVDPE